MMIAGLEPYGLFKLPSAAKVICNGGTFVGVEYEIRRKSQGQRRANRPEWGKALTLQPMPDSKDRWDLNVKLYSNAVEFHTLYHRIVALAIIGQTYWNDAGDLLDEPRRIAPKSWDKYHVHHINEDPFDNRLKNLAIVSNPLHNLLNTGFKLPRPPVGWGR